MLTSISHGLRFSSIITSKPTSSKQQLRRGQKRRHDETTGNSTAMRVLSTRESMRAKSEATSTPLRARQRLERP